MPMTRAKIEKARKAALEFVARCELLLIKLDSNLTSQQYNSQEGKWESKEGKPAPHDHSWGSKESGALRRNSMDLTRTLADLRKSDF